MKVNWNDISKSEAPGEYNVHDQCVLVQKSDIGIWKEHPNAVFDVVDAKFKDGGIGHVLNSFEDDVSSD